MMEFMIELLAHIGKEKCRNTVIIMDKGPGHTDKNL